MPRRPKSTPIVSFAPARLPSPGSRGAHRLARETDPADPGLTIACWLCKGDVGTPCLHLAGRRARVALAAERKPRAGWIEPATLTDLDADKALDRADAERITAAAVESVADHVGSDHVQRTHVPPDYVDGGAWVCLLVFVPTETPTR